MKQDFTNEQMIRELYKETSYLESMALAKQLQEDPDLKHEYKSMKKAKSTLDSIEMEPPVFAVQNILNYSQSSRLEREIG